MRYSRTSMQRTFRSPVTPAALWSATRGKPPCGFAPRGRPSREAKGSTAHDSSGRRLHLFHCVLCRLTGALQRLVRFRRAALYRMLRLGPSPLSSFADVPGDLIEPTRLVAGIRWNNARLTLSFVLVVVAGFLQNFVRRR